MSGSKLIGQNYTTPDLIAKVTGRAKYADDFFADGMLVARLLRSPMPHARVIRIDTSAALATPGVKAILTADELPPPADSVSDNGTVIKANPNGERALTNEPLYEGEPILAIAAVDELTAVEAIAQIEIEYEPLPFVVDPLDSLRPGGPNARSEGNHWVRPAPTANSPALAGVLPTIQERKWAERDFAEYENGRLPTGTVPDEWSFGDLEAGFKRAALVLDESFATSNVSHQPLETRTVLAYWRNGRVHIYCSTQSTAQTVVALARWLNTDPVNVSVITEYTGGGFGSKTSAAITAVVPALLSKKLNAPVVMRISREDEHFIGRARPGFQGRARVGFEKDGRVTALDLFVVADNGPYEAQADVPICGRIASLMIQPPAMRFRGISVLTNTPTRQAQRGPGGVQAAAFLNPILAKAARRLGIDAVEILRRNAPAGKAPLGPPDPRGHLSHTTSAFAREALDQGEELFRWKERKGRQTSTQPRRVRGVGAALSAYQAGTVGFDGLIVLKPDGRLSIHSGIGNHGTGSVFDVHRVSAELLGVPWDKCDVIWGSSDKQLPWTCISGGSQTTHAMSRAAHAAGQDAKRKLQEIASRDLGGAPDQYVVSDERVYRQGGGRGMTLAQAARRAIELGGKFDGHELPSTINKFTARSATALAGQGLVGVAKDEAPRDGLSYSFVAGFAEVEVDLEIGKISILDYAATADIGTVLHPRLAGAQVLGGSISGFGHALTQKWVYDHHYGVALARRFYQNRPLSILDVPQSMQWSTVNVADPETPVGARGVGEPPVGAGFAAVLNAIADALGDDVLRRAPVTLDSILTALEPGVFADHPLRANI